MVQYTTVQYTLFNMQWFNIQRCGKLLLLLFDSRVALCAGLRKRDASLAWGRSSSRYGRLQWEGCVWNKIKWISMFLPMEDNTEKKDILEERRCRGKRQCVRGRLKRRCRGNRRCRGKRQWRGKNQCKVSLWKREPAYKAEKKNEINELAERADTESKAFSRRAGKHDLRDMIQSGDDVTEWGNCESVQVLKTSKVWHRSHG